MIAVSSVLLLSLVVLAAWCAASVVAVPVLARCVRSQARANARLTRRLSRDAWADAHRR